jgi:glutathione S-transferase
MIRVHGVLLSPFVRKVLLTLEFKGIPYENVPVFPGAEDPAFRAISPLGKIPVLQDGDFTIPDTSVICRYLERTHPAPALYPADAQAEARACWLEEFGDSKLMDCCGGLFQQVFLRPRMLGEETEEDVVRDILEVRLPPLLDYLETQVPETGALLGDAPTIADLSVLTCFLQADYAGFAVDPGTHPRLASWLARMRALDFVAGRLEEEQAFVKSMAG